jgi:hypothetical protein
MNMIKNHCAQTMLYSAGRIQSSKSPVLLIRNDRVHKWKNQAATVKDNEGSE